jgi:hypothetical protein
VLLCRIVWSATVEFVVKGEQVYSVRYEAVNAMLLSEFLKEHRKVQEFEAPLRSSRRKLKALPQTSKSRLRNPEGERPTRNEQPAPQMVADNHKNPRRTIKTDRGKLHTS